MPAELGDSGSQLGKTLGKKVQHGATAALADLKTLAKHPVYVLNVAATAVYTGKCLKSRLELFRHMFRVHSLCSLCSSWKPLPGQGFGKLDVQ